MQIIFCFADNFPNNRSFSMGIFTPAARLLHKCHENVTICLLKQVVPDQARNQEGQSPF